MGGITNPMAEPEITKFLFDRSFDEEAKEAPGSAPETEADMAEVAAEDEVEPEQEVPTFSEEEVAAARQEGYAKGKGDGIREAATGIERRIADTLDGVGARLADLLSQAEEARDSTVQSGVSIATAITRKLFPELSRRGAVSEVEAIVAAALERGIEEPRVVVRVDPEIYGQVAEHIHAQAVARGFEGKVLVMEDPDLLQGDCRVEWSNGGAERDSASLWQEIDEIIERNLSLTSQDEENPEEGVSGQTGIIEVSSDVGGQAGGPQEPAVSQGGDAPAEAPEEALPSDGDGTGGEPGSGSEALSGGNGDVGGDAVAQDGVQPSEGEAIPPAPDGDHGAAGEMGGVAAEGMTADSREE